MMTSAPSKFQATASTSFVEPFRLSQKTQTVAEALAQSVRDDQEFSGQSILLAAKSLAESKNWSTVAISSESWAKLFALRAQLMSESEDVSRQCSKQRRGAFGPSL